MMNVEFRAGSTSDATRARVTTGMKTVPSRFSNEQASATPWAWLPALAQTTPRPRSSAESALILL